MYTTVHYNKEFGHTELFEAKKLGFEKLVKIFNHSSHDASENLLPAYATYELLLEICQNIEHINVIQTDLTSYNQRYPSFPSSSLHKLRFALNEEKKNFVCELNDKLSKCDISMLKLFNEKISQYYRDGSIICTNDESNNKKYFAISQKSLSNLNSRIDERFNEQNLFGKQ